MVMLSLLKALINKYNLKKVSITMNRNGCLLMKADERMRCDLEELQAQLI